jgi:hypothetical protein|tara:strand:+ start:1557 stop:1826 length:270 start_codon:yes stop_codon:yes gene_type:complete
LWWNGIWSEIKALVELIFSFQQLFFFRNNHPSNGIEIFSQRFTDVECRRWPSIFSSLDIGTGVLEVSTSLLKVVPTIGWLEIFQKRTSF